MAKELGQKAASQLMSDSKATYRLASVRVNDYSKVRPKDIGKGWDDREGWIIMSNHYQFFLIS